jgi:hypothetical protein
MFSFHKTFIFIIVYLIIYFIKIGLTKEKLKLKNVLLLIFLSAFTKPVLDLKINNIDF